MEFPEGSAAGSGGLGQVPARQRLSCPSGRERERKEVSADVRGAGAGARSTPTRAGALVAGEGDAAWSSLPHLAFGHGYTSRQPGRVQARSSLRTRGGGCSVSPPVPSRTGHFAAAAAAVWRLLRRSHLPSKDWPRPSPRPYSSGGRSQWVSETFSTSCALPVEGPRGEGAFPEVSGEVSESQVSVMSASSTARFCRGPFSMS